MQYHGHPVKYNDQAFHESRRLTNRDVMLARFRAAEESRMVTREAYGKRTAIFAEAVTRLSRVNHKVRRTLDDVSTGDRLGKPSFLCNTILEAVTCTLNSIPDDTINPPSFRFGAPKSVTARPAQISYDQLFDSQENDSEPRFLSGERRITRNLRAVINAVPKFDSDCEPGQISARSEPAPQRTESSSTSAYTEIVNRPRKNSKIENVIGLSSETLSRPFKVLDINRPAEIFQ